MFNFFHTNIPDSVLINIGQIKIYWYGLFIVTGILAAMAVVLKLAEKHKISKEAIIDSVFYLVAGGIIGARAYHIFLEFPYYFNNPIEIIKIWQGGLAIHGAILAGIVIAYFFAKKHKINFWRLLAVYTPGLAIGQAIGRWGNYFNQELFGLPTNLPWGIPIEPASRALEYYGANYYHPTFLYESLGSLLIFIILIFVHRFFIKKDLKFYEIIVLIYLGLYSILRFCLEFIRIDKTPEILNLRFPQIISLLILLIISLYLIKNRKKYHLRLKKV
ncbi:MAG: prolipoprotein diacylglyceryl transferase [Patescibacteria group bacterium]|nr:prolipoprotein diacylglyceryl transferase [Patescibacteria group bacterium]